MLRSYAYAKLTRFFCLQPSLTASSLRAPLSLLPLCSSPTSSRTVGGRAAIVENAFEPRVFDFKFVIGHTAPLHAPCVRSRTSRARVSRFSPGRAWHGNRYAAPALAFRLIGITLAARLIWSQCFAHSHEVFSLAPVTGCSCGRASAPDCRQCDSRAPLPNRARIRCARAHGLLSRAFLSKSVPAPLQVQPAAVGVIARFTFCLYSLDRQSIVLARH